jgi:hypothetical protein
MMKKVLILLAALLLPIVAAGQTYTAGLSGANEVGSAGDPDGAGLAIITINGTQVAYTILVSGVDAPTAAHIHRGAAGVNGDIVVNFNPSFVAGSAFGTVNATQEIVNEITANPAGFYVNVHNGPFPNGAVRGQLTGAGAATYFPVTGNVAGANNTKFVTDMRIVNLGTATATVSLEFIQSSPDGATGPTKTRSATVPAGGQLVLDNVTEDFLGIPGVLGAIRLVSDQEVRADIRVINDQRPVNAGTTGFSIEGQGFEDAKTAGVLPFLSQAADFRTNIGHFNPNAFAIEVTFTAHRNDGSVLGTATANVPAYRQLQLGAASLIPVLAGQSIDDFYVTYTSSAPVFVYASVVDNVNGDAVYVR